MILVKTVLFCLIVGIIFGSLFNRKFEEAIVPSYIGIMVILYIFYILNILTIGYVCLIAGIGVLFLIALYRVYREKTFLQLLLKMITPAFIVYAVVLTFIWKTTVHNTVRLIDELHLWAALPKILYYDGSLQMGSDILLLGYVDYIPGMPVLLYFFQKMNGEFAEKVLYFAYGSVGVSMMLPALKKLTWKQWYMIFPASVIIYMLPLTFYNTIYNDYTIFYKSIHVDPILGIALGFSAWLLMEKPWESVFDTIVFALSLSILVLLKSSGIAFVLVLLFFLWIGIGSEKQNKRLKRRLFITLFPSFIWLSWKLIISLYDAKITVDFSLRNSMNLSYLGTFCKNLLTQIVLYPRIESLSKYGTFVSIMVFLICVSVYVGRVLPKNKKKQYWQSWIALFLICIAFIIGYYSIYIGTFNQTMLSYPRYICTILTSFLIFIAMTITYNCKEIRNQIKNERYVVTGMILLVIFIAFFPFRKPVQIRYPDPVYGDAKEFAAQIENVIAGDIKKRTNVDLVIDKEYDSFSPDLHIYLHRRLYFLLLDKNIKIQNKLYLDMDSYLDNNNSESDYLIWIKCVGNEKTCEIVDKNHKPRM